MCCAHCSLHAIRTGTEAIRAKAREIKSRFSINHRGERFFNVIGTRDGVVSLYKW